MQESTVPERQTGRIRRERERESTEDRGKGGKKKHKADGERRIKAERKVRDV